MSIWKSSRDTDFACYQKMKYGSENKIVARNVRFLAEVKDAHAVSRRETYEDLCEVAQEIDLVFSSVQSPQKEQINDIAVLLEDMCKIPGKPRLIFIRIKKKDQRKLIFKDINSYDKTHMRETIIKSYKLKST